MSSRYGKGNIVYKLLIVILTAALALSLYYPKSLWDQEAKNLQIGRERMTNIYNSAVLFQRFSGDFTDSLDQLIEFLKTDSAYHALVDSSVTGRMDLFIAEVDSLRGAQVVLEEFVTTYVNPDDSLTLDSLRLRIDDFSTANRFLRDKMEALREDMLNYPYTPVADYDRAVEVLQRKDFYLNYTIIQRMMEQSRTQDAVDASKTLLDHYSTILSNLELTKQAMGGIYDYSDSLRFCPTIREPFLLSIQLVDSAMTIREVVVACPIDSVDSVAVSNDFVKSTIGALKISNHGFIKGGEKSWENKQLKK